MKNLTHESALLHVTGQAVYIDDMPIDDRLLLGFIFGSPFAYAKIKSFDIEQAKQTPDVISILSANDIPGEKVIGAVIHDDYVLANEYVTYVGQPIFLIAAKTEEAALRAKEKIQIEFEVLEPIITLEQAIEKNSILQPSRIIQTGNIEKGFADSIHTLEGSITTGAQEHWYLETQTSLAIPGEGKEMKVYCSTQNPTETQMLIAEVLGVNLIDVEIEIRRLGGGFGGKESQAAFIAIWAALLANASKRPVKIKLERTEDQIITGKRHPFLIQYKVGFEVNGKINAIDVKLHSNAGASTDLSMAILERAMFHIDNSYYIPHMKIEGTAWRTNTASNTAFRGFGGPQAIVGIEEIIDRIAVFLKKDASEIRFINFYGLQSRNVTPYGQRIENNRLFSLWEQLMKTSEYSFRRNEINEFNKKNEFQKKGMAIMPLKFGISFTTTFLNQAGALVNMYTDGSILVNHGGTEMGQGLYTKMQQVAASELGVDTSMIKVNATNTSKVPNTSPTAASSGTDLNGMAVKNAISKIKDRINQVLITDFIQKYPGLPTFIDDLKYEKNFIFDRKHPERKISFADAVKLVRLNRRSLSATGYYKTPDIYFDRNAGKGHPFYYFAFGMAVTEVLLDTLTGYVQVLRTDILNDVGDSINPQIDIGQIEGAYVQGLGWCISEDCKWNNQGLLLNNSPDTYKIPTFDDIPLDFRVNLLKNSPNQNAILKSKAVGEPPLMLAISAWLAIKNAISAVYNHSVEIELPVPATNEAIIKSIEQIKAKAGFIQ